MALPRAILVSLCEQSGTGYELTRRFDRSIGSFWNATHQQIYRTVRTMEADGWVSATVVAQQGRPDKKIYPVSDAGRCELRDSALHQYLVLRGGIRAEEATIDWLDEVTAALQTKPKQENR